jgi:hypothetical protein
MSRWWHAVGRFVLERATAVACALLLLTGVLLVGWSVASGIKDPQQSLSQQETAVAQNIGAGLVGSAVTVMLVDGLYRRRDRARTETAAIWKLASEDPSVVVSGFRDLGGRPDKGRFVDGTLMKRRFERAAWTRLDMAGINAEQAVFTGLRGSSVRFTNAKLRDASFRGADLTDADFTSADLRGARFEGATLDGTRFAGAQLEGAPFGASTKFAGADLRGTDLRQVSIDGMVLAGVVFDDHTQWPGERPVSERSSRAADAYIAV